MATRLLPLLCALALCACATGGTAAYGPASEPGRPGYSERFIESDRARIVYVADSRQAAQDGALRRAAELALARGYSHVEVVSRETGQAGPSGASRPPPSTRFGIGVGAVGVGVGVGVPVGRDTSGGRIREDLEVILRNDEGEGRRVYRAQDVLARLVG